jgi:hypothetical protein
MNATVLPELAVVSGETAERLVRLSAEQGLDAAEAEYILASGLATIQHVPRLWRIIRTRIGAGTTGTTAHQLLARLLDAVDKNLALLAKLKGSALIAGAEPRCDLKAVAGLAEAEAQLLEIRAEASRLVRIVDAPPRWPTEEQLKEAKESMRRGERLTAEEFRQALLDK